MLAPGDIAIDVICEFTRDGRIIPLRIIMIDEEGERQIYKVLSYREIEVISGLKNSSNATFECRFEVYGVLKTIKVIYFADTRQWAYRK